MVWVYFFSLVFLLCKLSLYIFWRIEIWVYSIIPPSFSLIGALTMEIYHLTDKTRIGAISNRLAIVTVWETVAPPNFINLCVCSMYVCVCVFVWVSVCV